MCREKGVWVRSWDPLLLGAWLWLLCFPTVLPCALSRAVTNWAVRPQSSFAKQSPDRPAGVQHELGLCGGAARGCSQEMLGAPTHLALCKERVFLGTAGSHSHSCHSPVSISPSSSRSQYSAPRGAAGPAFSPPSSLPITLPAPSVLLSAGLEHGEGQPLSFPVHHKCRFAEDSFAGTLPAPRRKAETSPGGKH